MARQHAASVLAAALVVGILASIPAEVRSIGVCYGVVGDPMPSASDVVKLYVSRGITGMRIYKANAKTLAALVGTGIDLIVDVPNDQLAEMASSPDAASKWVQDNVVAYPGVSIRYIAVGNEVEGNDPRAQNILPAMQNMNAALSMAGFEQIKVSTAVQSGVTTGYPPSHGIFSTKSAHMPPIALYLAKTGAPLLANVYPYFAYTGNPTDITIDYALFTSSGTVVQDDNGLAYQNLFDALVDTFYAALQSAGAADVGIVVSESGWPSAGATAATVSNAQAYNQALIDHVSHGTPKVPQPLETYIFAMFNENEKGGAETEKHFGLFNPDMSSAYDINF
nr:glucan endo-1,3-beta-glucosidase, acidic isoform-like [Lolium perenne]